MNVQSGVRQPQQFIVLVPGVTGDSSNHTINGGQLNSSTLQVDGHNWQLINRPGIMNSWPPPFEAIEEFKLNTAQYGAENPIGTAVTQFTFKSGTDEFHGSFSHLSRNDAFNAPGFSAGSRLRPSSMRAPSPRAVRSSRGRPTSSVSSHATADGEGRTRRGGLPCRPADETGGLFRICISRRPLAPDLRPIDHDGQRQRGIHSGAIPQQRDSPRSNRGGGENGAGLMVDPTLPGIINNHVIVGGAGENLWMPNIKIDHSWTPNQITRGSYFGTRRDRVRPSGYEGPLGPGDASDFNNNNYMVSHSSVWSSSLVTEFRFAIAPWIGPHSTWASLTLREPMHWASAVFLPCPASRRGSISAASLARWAMRTARFSRVRGSITRSEIRRTGPRAATSSSSLHRSLESRQYEPGFERVELSRSTTAALPIRTHPTSDN